MSDAARPTRAQRVFIIYVAPDEAWAAWIRSALRDAPVEVVPAGGDALMRGSGAGPADRVLAVYSRASKHSAAFAAEVSAAHAQDLAVTFLVVDDVDLPTGGRRIDGRGGDLGRLAQRIRRAAVAAPPRERVANARRGPVAASRPTGPAPPRAEQPLRMTYPPPAPGEDGILRADLLAALAGTVRRGRPVVIVGPAGTGKTTLAAQFAAGLADEFGDVAWLPGSRLPRAARTVGSRIRSRPGGALVVIDDIDAATSDAARMALAELRDAAVVMTARSEAELKRLEIGAFATIAMPTVLDPSEVRAFAAARYPGLADTDLAIVLAEAERSPLLVPALLRTAAHAGGEQAATLFEGIQTVASLDHGAYYLDTDDPRVITVWERSFAALAQSRGHAFELAEFAQGSWRRKWQRMAGGAAAGAVPAGPPPGSESAAQSIANLLVAADGIPNLTALGDDFALVKATNETGIQITAKTLTPAERARLPDGGLAARPEELKDLLWGGNPKTKGIPTRTADDGEDDGGEQRRLDPPGKTYPF